MDSFDQITNVINKSLPLTFLPPVQLGSIRKTGSLVYDESVLTLNSDCGEMQDLELDMMEDESPLDNKSIEMLSSFRLDY